jgi:hypothetical protein
MYLVSDAATHPPGPAIADDPAKTSTNSRTMLMSKLTEKPMSKRTAVLALLALISSVTVADARGGRTTTADCAAGSDDPDCPDAPDPHGKPPPTTPPPRK